MEVEHFLEGRKVEAVVVLERRDGALHHAAELVLHASGPKKSAPWSHRAAMNTMAAMLPRRESDIATWRLRRPPKRRTLGLKFWTRRTSQPDAKRIKRRRKGGNHVDQAWPHLFAFACCVAGRGGDDRLRPGHGADELTAQSLSLGGRLGQAAGRANLGLDLCGRYRCRRHERLGRRALRRGRGARPDAAGRAVRLRRLELGADPEI